MIVCEYINFNEIASPPYSYNSLYIISFKLYKSFSSFVISFLSNTTILSNSLESSCFVSPFFLISSIALNINSSLSSNLFNVLYFVCISFNLSFSFFIFFSYSFFLSLYINSGIKSFSLSSYTCLNCFSNFSKI